jgi:hypothetical protein
MEIFYDSEGSYTDACVDPLVTNLTSDVDDKNGDNNGVPCNDGGQSWAASSALVTTGDNNSTQYFCVDHTGFAGVRTTELTGTICPAS